MIGFIGKLITSLSRDDILLLVNFNGINFNEFQQLLVYFFDYSFNFEFISFICGDL